MDITHIVSVYTKRDVLPHMLASLTQQTGHLTREFIFLDDHSKDDSVAVLKACTQNIPNVRIVECQDNRGPSVRLNEGAKLARGDYLHFLDHDDIVPANATALMHRLLQETQADFLYGRWEKTNQTPQQLLGRTISENPYVRVSDDPLRTLLNGRFKRMCVLVKREVFLSAGGFDEGVFIQDESLPLRLAMHAKTMAIIDAVVNLVPRGEGNLSDNKTQLNHDRFLAYAHAWQVGEILPGNLRDKLFQRALSAWWKERRGAKAFGIYLLSKFAPASLSQERLLDEAAGYFRTLPSVLRP